MTTKIEENVRDAIVKGAFAAAASPQTSTDSKDVNIITSKVLSEVAPVVAHATNSEAHWWESRVTVGNYVAMASTVIGPLIGRSFSPEDQALITAVITGLGVVGGAAYSLYGRWIAKRPLGK
jgi:hypothetical protein